MASSEDVNVTNGSKERVAYELMEKIHVYESDAKKDRKYFLTLYRQCLKATAGQNLESILKEA